MTRISLHSYVGLSLMNSLMANRFIRDHAVEIDPNNRLIVGEWNRLLYGPSAGLLKPNSLNIIVDSFMARYPRGKGTAGSELLRTFYAACYTIKLAQSRTAKGRRIEASNASVISGMRSAPLDVLLRFTKFTTGGSPFSQTGEALGRDDLKGVRSDTLQYLFERGLISGRYGSDGKPESFWLTDRGIAAFAIARVRKNGEEKEAERAKQRALLTQMLVHHDGCISRHSEPTGDPQLLVFHEEARDYLKNQLDGVS